MPGMALQGGSKSSRDAGVLAQCKLEIAKAHLLTKSSRRGGIAAAKRKAGSVIKVASDIV